MRFHAMKMAEINKIIKEYWINTYKGNGKILCSNYFLISVTFVESFHMVDFKFISC